MAEPVESQGPAPAQHILHDGKLTAITEFCAVYALTVQLRRLGDGTASSMEVMNIIKFVYPNIGEIALVDHEKMLDDAQPLYEQLQAWLRERVPVVFGERGRRMLNEAAKRMDCRNN